MATISLRIDERDIPRLAEAVVAAQQNKNNSLSDYNSFLKAACSHTSMRDGQRDDARINDAMSNPRTKPTFLDSCENLFLQDPTFTQLTALAGLLEPLPGFDEVTFFGFIVCFFFNFFLMRWFSRFSAKFDLFVFISK